MVAVFTLFAVGALAIAISGGRRLRRHANPIHRCGCTITRPGIVIYRCHHHRTQEPVA